MTAVRTLMGIFRLLNAMYRRNQAANGFREVAANTTTDTTVDSGGYYCIIAVGGACVLEAATTVAAEGDQIAADRTLVDGSINYGNWSTVGHDTTGTGVMWVYPNDR